ncbi:MULTISPECIES: hypothetical protein [Mycolicibacterium]|uniref:Uncharacterized protein n=1 Tax=Mycolicibacterium alvei TaxID=67081 RepID=A0A6N4V039_9MYCO|nr:MULTISPECIES: hypothetical protein [Mycolicibacterium]MCV6998683.1 hypothetical protein [Mycolicibacterium alvei]BBX30656.1 hypothetical protein MALV_57810 [Mycolicibacterium alvei]
MTNAHDPSNAAGQRWSIEVTDPEDPSVVHVFTGSTEEEAEAAADAALGVTDANEREQQ